MLYDKWRPKTWDAFAGHAGQVRKLRAMLERPSFGGGALWVTGPSGSGKTTLAHLCAASVQASDWDIVELDGDKCTVDAVRQIDRDMGKRGGMFGGSGWRVWIVNEAHAMTPRAVQAWLTLLEGLPDKRLVIFTTTERGEQDLFGQFTGPLLSRCAHVSLFCDGSAADKSDPGGTKNLLAAAEYLRTVAQAEGLDGQPVSAYVGLLRRKSGNLRAALCAIEAGEMLT